MSERRTLERFMTRGIDAETQPRIGDLPRGRGVLGVLIDDPRPLRLDDVGAHPALLRLPARSSADGDVPRRAVLIRGEAWGNLYLTEKEGGEFDDEDEEAIVVLADWAAIAIENARLLPRRA